MNLKQAVPSITHESFCKVLEHAYMQKWDGIPVKKTLLRVEDLRQVPELMEIYSKSAEWDWRFGETPIFSNSLEHKFDWALVDVQFNVEKGKIVKGQIFSDCLVPVFIDALNEELATGDISYDINGIKTLCDRVRFRFEDESTMNVVT